MDAESSETTESTDSTSTSAGKKDRNFPALDLKDQATLSTDTQPVFVVQSPKTPTLSRKLKAVSLDSEPQQQTSSLEISRDVFSMPNTPKKQIKQKLSCDFDDGVVAKTTLAPSFSSNLKKFASNNSISGSQTLKTLPESNDLQDFSDCPNPEPPKFRAKGLLERRGSNANLTIDLGSTQNIADVKPVPLSRLNTAKSVSNLYMSSMSMEKCVCVNKSGDTSKASTERRKSQEACGNCTIYESEPNLSMCKSRCQIRRCHCCAKSRRKSLSNENLYVPPCRLCEGDKHSSEVRNCKGNNRKAVFPRQIDSDAVLTDEFKQQLQNIQYLQTSTNVLSLADLKQSFEESRLPKLQKEFWEVPLNLPEKCEVTGSQSKNRYRRLWPNEHSRVQLPTGDGYIHANYIKGHDYTETAYIATQGPLSHTCTDFWEMVWHSQCKCIVMLTGLVEKGRSKCELYFPLGKSKDTHEKTFFRHHQTPDRSAVNSYDPETSEFEEKNEVTFGNYRITYLSQWDLGGCQIRQLELRKIDLGNVEPRRIYHYWLSNWPDHKKTNAEQVLKVALDVLKYLDTTKGDTPESLSTKPKEPSEVQHFDLNYAAPAESLLLSVSNQDASDFSKTHQPKTFSFDVIDSDGTATTMTDSSDQVTIATTSSRTFQSNCNQSFTTKRESRSKFSFSESATSTFQASSIEESSQIRLQQDTSTKSSSREINKETLTNRCSLDSKLQNLNDFKSHFKREVCMVGPLKGKSMGLERRKSAEQVRLPVVVHCSAGIGRTGCFIAILNGIQQLKLHKNVDILAILCTLRLNRGGMVQTVEQYELIHRVLSLYSESML